MPDSFARGLICRTPRSSVGALALATVLAWSSTSAVAQENPLGGLADNATFTFRAIGAAFPQQPGSSVSDDDTFHLKLQQQIETSADLTSSLSLSMAAYAAYSSQPKEYTGVFRTPGSENRGAEAIDFTKLFLTYYADAFELVLGKQLIEVGVAEMVSPTNRFGLADGTQPIDPEAFGVWQAGLIYPMGDDIVSLRVTPFHERSVIPSPVSRWAGTSGDPEFVSLSLPAGTALPPTGVASITEEFHSANPENWGYLLRYQGVGDGFDYFGLVHYGPSVYPVLKQVGPTTFRKVDPLAWSIGGGVSAVLDRWKLYGEAIAQFTRDSRDQDFLRYTLGVSYRENEIANSLGFDEIKPIVEFTGDETFDEQTAAGYVVNSEAARIFHNSATARLDILHNNRWSYSLGGTYNFEGDDWTIGAGMEYRPNDNTKVQLSGAMFEGVTDTHFGRWKRNDNVRLGLEYSF